MRGLAFRAGALCLVGAVLASHAQTPRETSPALRFHGLYEARDATSVSYLKFFHDRTVLVGGFSVEHMQGELPSDEYKRVLKMSGPLNEFGERVKYTVTGGSIQFSQKTAQGIADYKGTVVIDGLEIERHLRSSSDREKRSYRFVRFVASIQPDGLPRPPQEASVDLGMAGRSTRGNDQRLTVRVSLGTADTERPCETFAPANSPAVFPAGTTRLAYQVRIDPHPVDPVREFQPALTVSCPSRDLKGIACSKSENMDGRNVDWMWSNVVWCKDGSPFTPGRFKLDVFYQPLPQYDPVLFESIGFEIEAAGKRPAAKRRGTPSNP